ncbi:TatD family deoxyribonuclease [Spirosoma sp. HMF4905]|uniref:TatD family deoxyribonuclease n=1 Tax=Spirosoma arboris TaxID=2682092 RepID=A0A7K1SFV6_9BACT|nr:Qat anti-phage system TatD family nuclease QatD [Spirosoma arboris]MVM32446.1 TatD family deoxyribonuclease [Spirosoma arboris]
MNISLVDYHCHLDLYPDFERLVSECEHKQIYTLTVTTTPRAWPRNFALTKDLTFVRAALGLHPQLIEQYANELNLWEQYLPQAKFIGEIGLDAGPGFYKSFEKQTAVFDHIIKQCSKYGDKVLTIHSVRSASQILNILEKHALLKNNKAVLHWFSGSLAEARRAINMGCYFSINLPMVSNPKNIDLLNIIPKRLVLTETDGPFTVTNGVAQKPENVLLCLDKISTLWNQSIQETKMTIVNNLVALES